MKRIIRDSVTSSKSTDAQKEYEYRKNIYLKRKHEFETLGEDDNNDVLSREEKMRIAKAEMDKVAPESVDSAAEYSDYKSDRRIGVTNQRYKGYMIRLDRAGYGYNVYDKNGELEDAGYPSKEAARNFIDGLVSEADDEVESSVDIDEETEDPKWICLDIKHVRDSDGMLTDYALYTTEDEDKYICMFGDVDAYPPDEMYADAEFDTEEEALEWFEDYTGPGDEDEDEDYDIYHDVVDAAEELDEDEDDLDHPDQEFDSADTSINSTKLLAIYKMISIPKGSVGIDFGGGKWDNAIEHIRDLGATLCVYDPYNRSKAYNKETLKTLRANGGADWAVTSNVLNVIKEPSARKAVLENISKITKSGAPIYITVYEGSGKGDEGPTKAGYQLNRRTADYLDEIREVFPDANRKGKLIVATNSRTVNSSTNIKASSTEGYVYTYCDECGKKNRVKVTFNNFNEPFNDTEYKCKYCGTNNLLTDPHSYDENGNVVEASQSYLDRIEELMEQGLDEETASREAYAEFYPDEYDSDDYDSDGYDSDEYDEDYPDEYDGIYSSTTSSNRYWYFTRHGVQPGSVPKYVNILDIVDKPEGSYFLADGVILTKDLRDYDIKERRPEGEIYSSKQPNSKLNQIKDKITKVVKNVMMSAEFGFPEDEVEEYSVVEVDPSGKIEVRAEVGYDGLMTLCDALNPIVQRYDKDSYFEPVQPGIIQAWIENKNDVVESSKSPNSVANKYPEYMKVSRGGQDFSVHYNLIDNSPSADAHKMWLEFQASVSAIKPYDDADYAWADIRNGHIDVIRNGKVVKRSYYFNADDMDVENTEWCDIIIDEAIDLIAKINKDIEPRMVYNSTSIAARNKSNITSSADKKIRPIDELDDVTDQLRDDLMQKLVDVMSSPNFGFSRDEAIDYSRVDIRFDDDENRIEVEVGAEVDYDGLMQIAQDLDPIIQSYDIAAYFDAEDAGLLVAFIPYKSLRNHMKVNSASDIPEPSLDPPEYDDPEEVDEDVTVEFDMDRVRIDVDKSRSWEYMDDSFLDAVMTDDTLYSEEYDVEVRDRNGLLEDLDDILKYDIPVEAGEYRISCHITLVYHITGIEKYDEYPDDNYGDSSEYSTENAEVKFDFHDSYVEDFRIVD